MPDLGISEHGGDRGMNLIHRWLCGSARWKEVVGTYILPWTLEGLDLGSNVLEVGPGPGVSTDLLRSRVAHLTTGARKVRWIGLRRWPNWMGNCASLQLFAMRSMASGDGFHRAYTNATQQALLEGHEHAFDYFGGVFRTLRYDNMTSVVKKILRGRQRIETDRIIAFRSHWGYRSEYCNPAKGNEKGGVEGELGWYRRNCLVPVPEAKDLAALNAQLLAACVAHRDRTISGKSMTVGEASQYERAFLAPRAEEGFPLEEVLSPLVVDGKGREGEAQLVFGAVAARAAGVGGGGAVAD